MFHSRIIALSIFLGLPIFALISSERITDFAATIEVKPDASLAITETITVLARGISIRHGIVREFPTRYRLFAKRLVVGFHLKEILFDGNKVFYRVQDYANGKYIYIGDPDALVTPGIHTYTISYTTTRQLGFYADYDELFWNVTGNGWRLPIDKASARVILPPGIAKDQIIFEGYTGYQGSRDASYRASIDQQNQIHFATTQPLQPSQGLTIVVTWPKGFVTVSWLTNLINFFFDYLFLIILLLGLVVLTIYYCLTYSRAVRALGQQPIIPLFYPPDEVSPGAVSYLMHKTYSNKTFAAQIVAMAVNGYLKIEYIPGWFSGSYKLIASSDNPESMPKEYLTIYQQLFATKKTITVSKGDRSFLNQAISSAQKALERSYSGYFDTHSDTIIFGVAISVLFLVLSLLFESFDILHVVYCSLCFMVILLFVQLLSLYSKKGKLLMNQIEGFKLFLETTETERMKVIGTPPTKTPELYEKYLPYAMALGVEEAWSHQFAPIFDRLQAQGHPYVPLWYMGHGRPFRALDAKHLGSAISHSLSSAIASSSSLPGLSSGRGGRGSSGGGGGGGGGGGW